MYRTRPLTLFVVTVLFVTAVVISLMASSYTVDTATPGGRHANISMNAPPEAPTRR
jgi:hypothetical protein